MSWWRDRPFECTVCGWQGMQRPSEVDICPECGSDLMRRTWLDTWGLAVLILCAVVCVVLFVAYFGRGA